MSVLSKTMVGFLGHSWKTSLLGYAQFLVVAVYTGYQGANGQLDTQGWIQLVGSALIGVALRVAKDHDVSNSPTPMPSPAAVTPSPVIPNPNASK
jgi:hypothetical protein